MYPHYDFIARDLLHYFLNKYFPDTDNLVEAHEELTYKTDTSKFDFILTGENYQEDYKIVQSFVRQKGENIPALVNAYMNLSPTMKTFGTALNDTFGNVEETGILIKIADIYEQKKERHIMHIRRERNSVVG
jgi:hypothetical protein